MDHTVENKDFPGVFEATPLRAPVRPWGHAPRQANPVLTQGRRGAQGRDTPPCMFISLNKKDLESACCISAFNVHSA